MRKAVVLAVDLGGSSMKGAVVTEVGEVVAAVNVDTPRMKVVEALLDLLQTLADAAAEAECDVTAGGVVTPGIVDEPTGVVRYASNLGWRDVPLREILSNRFDFPLAVGHDVRAAGLAEHLLGAGRGSAEFVLVPIGTGVAAALVTQGATITGATGAAGEFGHIPVVPGGEACTCGQRGCLEVYASGAGVARRYAVRSGVALSSREIVSRLGADNIADEVWNDGIRVLAQGLAIMTLLLDPAVIVIGGGFARAGNALLDPLRPALASGLVWRGAPSVVLSRLGSDAGQIGAAILAFRAAERGAVVAGWPVVERPAG